MDTKPALQKILEGVLCIKEKNKNTTENKKATRKEMMLRWKLCKIEQRKQTS